MSAGAKKAAVLGYPVEHSLSPTLHDYWLKHYQIDGLYTKMAVEPVALGATLKQLQAEGFAGVNLTLPHKEAALAFIDELDPLAERAGAVNTVIFDQHGASLGRNTDIYGFTQNILSADYYHRQRPAVILGAGGAARSAAVALLAMGVSDIRLCNRTQQRAQELADLFGASVSVYNWGDAAALENAALLVNATSLGLKNQPPLPIDLAPLPKDALVTDMVYVPLITPLLEQAEARGNKIVDGLGMLLHQAKPAFAAFFGVDPEVTPELRAHILKAL